MKEVTVSSVFVLGKRRKAFVLGEALILIIVVLIAFGGIFSSMAFAMRMRERSRVDLDSYLVAQAWFDALESYKNPELIQDQATLRTAALEASEHLGGYAHGSYFRVHIFDLAPEYKGTQQGTHRIELSVKRYGLAMETPLIFSRAINSSSSNTVQDNVYKRRER